MQICIRLAVYKYLTLNGCRWLFPGVDGEFIPIQNVKAIQYHKMADCRFRGQCNEGAENQQCMLETIDFSPKIGLNAYMIEFDIPKIYYDWYYEHFNNTANREPEPISEDTVLQWKRMCEVEIAKRGLQFHDMGHGWNAESFGISTVGGWNLDADNPVPEEARQYLALIDGKRDLFNGVALNTNFCMSNAKARKIVTKTVCDYAQLNTNVDYLHVWLADAHKNQCECEECRKKTPSDWYVILLNEIDEELTARKLDTHIAFCVYSDTQYEPTCEYIKNPKRFTMQLGAISRSYLYSVEKDPKVETKTTFELNKSGRFETMEEYIVHVNEWRKFAPCDSIAYEYHFWKHQFYAPGTLSFARRIYEDVFSYKSNGFDGIIEDGSQRASVARGEVEGITFIRRYRMKDGSVVTNPKLDVLDQVLGPIGEADKTVQLIKIQREDAPDIAIVHYANHPDVVGGRGICPDWPGFMRDTVEAALAKEANGKGVRVIFFNGAQGDINQWNSMKGEYPKGVEHSRHMGRVLAGVVLSIYKYTEPVSCDMICFKQNMARVATAKGTKEDVEKAKLLNEKFVTEKEKTLQEYSFNDVVMARKYIRLEESQALVDLNVLCISLGDIVFVGLPGEPFTEIGRQIKENSPFSMTLVCCNANGSEGYFLTDEALNETGYEASGSLFLPGVATEMINTSLNTLQELQK